MDSCRIYHSTSKTVKMSQFIKPSKQLISFILFIAIFVSSQTPVYTAATNYRSHYVDDDAGIYSYYNDGSSINNNSNDDLKNDPYHHNGDYSLDLTGEWGKSGTRVRENRCVNIPANMTLCQNIGYDKMLLPNSLDHDSLTEVTQQAKSWVPLVNINCHPDVKVFLCSLFSPVCVDRLIYPCRSLCEGVYNTCFPRMAAHDYPWPEMLNCSKFPLDNDMCIKLIHQVVADNNCSACRHPLTYESLIDHFCKADVVMKVTLKGFNDDVDGNRELVLRKKKKLYKVETVSRKAAKRLTPIIHRGASCVCETINKTQERYLLMGKKKGDKLIIIFGIPWDKKNKEFKKGLKAIRKSKDCKGLFSELSRSGANSRGEVASEKKKGGKKGGKNKEGRKKKGKGKKGKRRGKKGKKGKGKKNKKNKKNRKGKRKNRKNKGKRGNKRGSKESSTPKQTMPPNNLYMSQQEKWAREDKALNNFMKASN